MFTDWQTIASLLTVAIAAGWLLLRLSGIGSERKSGGCGTCGGCGDAEPESKPNLRPLVQIGEKPTK